MSLSSVRRPSGAPPDVVQPPAAGYDGTGAFPSHGPIPARSRGERLYVTITALIVVLPFLALGLAGGCSGAASSIPPTSCSPSSCTRSRDWA